MNDPADNNWEPSNLELEQHEMIASLTAENTRLRECVSDVLGGVCVDDPRLNYVTIQLSRLEIAELRKVVGQ